MMLTAARCQTLAILKPRPKSMADSKQNRKSISESETGSSAIDKMPSTPTRPPEQQQVEYRLHSPHLPLAVYREVAAHLRQIDGVKAGLLPQNSKEFDYLQSQVGGIWIRYSEEAPKACQTQVEVILTYYGDRYGQWETLGK